MLGPSRRPILGDIVRFQGVYTRVTGYTTIDYLTCAILEVQDGRRKDIKGHVGAVPLREITWTGKQFIAGGEK